MRRFGGGFYFCEPDPPDTAGDAVRAQLHARAALPLGDHLALVAREKAERQAFLSILYGGPLPDWMLAPHYQLHFPPFVPGWADLREAVETARIADPLRFQQEYFGTWVWE